MSLRRVVKTVLGRGADDGRAPGTDAGASGSEDPAADATRAGRASARPADAADRAHAARPARASARPAPSPDAGPFEEPQPDDPEDFAGRVHGLVAEIPPGRTMTYGEVAAALGSRASRMVGQVMAHSGGTLPWWRVVRSGGHPPLGHEEAALPHYESEGTPLTPAGTVAGYRVDVARAHWTPET